MFITAGPLCARISPAPFGLLTVWTYISVRLFPGSVVVALPVSSPPLGMIVLSKVTGASFGRAPANHEGKGVPYARKRHQQQRVPVDLF
jgi:hypothetical protein